MRQLSTLLLCIMCFCALNAQDNILDENQYISVAELEHLLNLIKSAPKIHDDCLTLNDCEKTKAYADALHNLREDLREYHYFIWLSKDAYKAQWLTYLENTTNNVNYRQELNNQVALSEAFLTIGSVILDVVNIGSAIKNHSVAHNIPELIIAFIDKIDVAISALNLISKVATQDGNTSIMNEISGDSTLNNFYVVLRSEFDFIKESISNIDGLRELARTWSELNHIQRKIKLDNPSITGVVVAIGNLLALIASHEIDELKQDVKDLEEIIKKEEAFQGNVYDKYHLHYKLIQLINAIKIETDYSYYNLRNLNANCFNALERHPRKKRDTIGFARDLRFYKPYLSKTSKTIAKSWKGLKDCPTESAKPYQFLVLDGYGQNTKAQISINSGFKNFFDGNSMDTEPIKLHPHTYQIYIRESNNRKRPSIYISDFKITGKEQTDLDNIRQIILKPYGLLSLNVIENSANLEDYTSSKKPIEYTLSVFSNNRMITKIKGKGKTDIDLPANKDLELHIKNLDGKVIKKRITLQPTKTKNLEIIFDELAKAHSFEILDGTGKKITPYFEITKNDGEIVYEKGPSNSTLIKLSPGNYEIKLNGSTSFNGFKISKATLSDFKINGNEDKTISLKPYGRVHLDVVDKEGKPVDFRYQFSHNGKNLASSFIVERQLVKTDVQAEVPLRLELTYNYISEVKDVTLTAGKVNTLHYVYDDGKFIEEHQNTESTPNTTVREGYVKGVLYNSNDGDCYLHKGQTLEFSIRDRQFYNLKTGQLVTSVLIKPGERLEVAIPESEGHFRANPIIDGKKESRISFWYYRNVSDNWWYSAGCKNGTKPKQRCFDGKAFIDCKSFGD